MWLLRRALVLGLSLAVLTATSRGPAVEAATVGGPFRLIDQDGRVRTEQGFLGSWLLIYFGFTYCPSTCPTALLEITDALERFAEVAPEAAARVVPLFVTIDPERDDAELMRSYVGSFHPRLVGLTGSPEQIARIARHYGVLYRRAPGGGPDGYLMDHSSFIFLMGPQGEYLTHFEPGATAGEIAEELGRRVRR